MNEDRDAIERTHNRVMAILGRGRIKLVDDTGPVQFVQVQLGKNETQDKRPRIIEYGFVSNPPVDTDAVMVFLRGDRSSGVVIGTNSQASRKVGLQPGDVGMHDNRGQFIMLDGDGITVDAAHMPVMITNAASLTVNVDADVNVSIGGNATVDVTGDVGMTVGGNVNMAVGGNIASSATGWTHTGPFTVNGSLTGLSGMMITGTHPVSGLGGYVSGSFKFDTASLTFDTCTLVATGCSFMFNGHDLGEGHAHFISGGTTGVVAT